jgi:hypothetical protein
MLIGIGLFGVISSMVWVTINAPLFVRELFSESREIRVDRGSQTSSNESEDVEGAV